LDVVRSEYELGVGNALPQSQLDAMQTRVTELRDVFSEEFFATKKVVEVGL